MLVLFAARQKFTNQTLPSGFMQTRATISTNRPVFVWLVHWGSRDAATQVSRTKLELGRKSKSKNFSMIFMNHTFDCLQWSSWIIHLIASHYSLKVQAWWHAETKGQQNGLRACHQYPAWRAASRWLRWQWQLLVSKVYAAEGIYFRFRFKFSNINNSVSKAGKTKMGTTDWLSMMVKPWKVILSWSFIAWPTKVFFAGGLNV